MSLIRQPSEWQPPDRDRAASAGTQHKVVRRTVQRIGRGTLACPDCDLPLLPVHVGISDPISCPFCGQVQPARRFLRVGGFDAPGNEVHLIARILQ